MYLSLLKYQNELYTKYGVSLLWSNHFKIQVVCNICAHEITVLLTHDFKSHWLHAILTFLCVPSSLLPDRKLKTLFQRPLNCLPESKDGYSLLLFWYWEECLKQRYVLSLLALSLVVCHWFISAFVAFHSQAQNFIKQTQCKFLFMKYVDAWSGLLFPWRTFSLKYLFSNKCLTFTWNFIGTHENEHKRKGKI